MADLVCSVEELRSSPEKLVDAVSTRLASLPALLWSDCRSSARNALVVAWPPSWRRLQSASDVNPMSRSAP